MVVNIEKSRLAGMISAPPSKSLAHRYIICAALSEGKSQITNIDMSEDIKATLDCVKELGALVSIDSDRVTITGIDEQQIADSVNFMCRESGSTMRFFMGLSMYYGKDSYFYGSQTLRNRPFGIYEDICREQGIDFVKEADRIHIKGRLRAGEYEIKGNISSQFITGLLYSLPMLKDDSLIKLIPPVESRSYIDLTIQALRMFSVDVHWNENDENQLVIKGGQSYRPNDIRVEGDCSNAAFLEAFNTVSGDVQVKDVNPDTLQGDRVYIKLFKELYEYNPLEANSVRPVIDISDCPDLGPILFAVAAANHGGLFTGTKRLKIKESDRGTVMCAELKKFGIDSIMEENSIEIIDGELCKPNELLEGHNDHRIVMSMSFLSTITGGRINEAEAVRKSYPGFFEDIVKLGAKVIKEM